MSRLRDAGDPDREEPSRVGIVLGGGGTVGAAYHSGVLAALDHDLGFDARDAGVIVGTSAGSLIGGLLRVGVPPSDLAAMTVGAEAHEAHPSVVDALANRPEFPPFSARHLLRIPRLLGPSAVAGLAVLSLRRGPSSLSSLAMLLPDGSETLDQHVAFLDEVLGRPWPEDPLLVCATRRRDCRRTVFGTGGRSAPLSKAVAASCAVPGYFSGVEIGRHCYVDGGVISATNADVLRRHDLDLVIVVSPMTGTDGGRSVSSAVRRLCRRALDREIAALDRHGIPAVVIEPGPAVQRHMTHDFMSDQALTEIVGASFLDTGAQILRRNELRWLGDRPLRLAG
jgi:NTE family protein